MSKKKKKEKGELKSASFMGFSISPSEEANIAKEELEETVVSDEKINAEENTSEQILEVSEEKEAFKEVKDEPAEECKHEFEMQNGGTYKKNSKGIPHFYKNFVCKKCGYSEMRVIG